MMNKKIRRRKIKNSNLQVMNLILLIGVLSFASFLIFRIKTNEIPSQQQNPSSAVTSQEQFDDNSEKLSVNSIDNENEVSFSSQQEQEVPTVKYETENKDTEFSFSLPQNIKSEAVYFMDLASDKVICEMNGEKKMYPASLTKIMTALVALEKLDDINEPITVEYQDYEGLFEKNASIAGFLVGETVPAVDLIYAILLPSGAEASASIARYLFGSEEKFVEAMNEKAKQMGLEGTHYMNTSGLHDDEHFTTPRDVAILLKKAIENPVLKNIVSTLTYTCSKTSEHPDGLVLYSTLKTQYNIFGIKPQFIEGGKTGFTYEAGLCLASFCNRDGKQLLLVTMNAPKEENVPYASITDNEEIYKSYFDQNAS